MQLAVQLAVQSLFPYKVSKLYQSWQSPIDKLLIYCYDILIQTNSSP
jgi:hypothetical protein